MSDQSRRLSRRAFLRSAALGGAGLAGAHLLGCGDDGGAPAPTATTGATPAAGATATPGAFGWRQPSTADPLPAARRDHSLVSDGERLYLFAGRNPEPLADLWRYDIAGNSWAGVDAPDGPPARFGHNAVWNKAQMLVFGGQAGGAFFNDLWAFDLPTGSWNQLAGGESAPSARYGAGGALGSEGRLLVTHGFTSQGRFDDTWQFTIDGWADISAQGARPVERCLMRAVWDPTKERLLIFGGQTNATPFLGDLWALASGSWREIAAEPKPSPRNFYAMAFADQAGQALLFGGRTEQGPANDLWLFDSAAEAWSQPSAGGEAPSARYGHDAAWVADSLSLFVFGGNDGNADLNDLWVLNTAAF